MDRLTKKIINKWKGFQMIPLSEFKKGIIYTRLDKHDVPAIMKELKRKKKIRLFKKRYVLIGE